MCQTLYFAIGVPREDPILSTPARRTRPTPLKRPSDSAGAPPMPNPRASIRSHAPRFRWLELPQRPGSFKLASSGRPCRPAHTASRTWARRSAAGATVVTPSAFPHFPRSRPRPCAHGSAPHARAFCTLPQDHVPVWGHARSRFSGHVANQWSRSLAHAWRSLSHATARPLGHVPISSSRPPGHVPSP